MTDGHGRGGAVLAVAIIFTVFASAFIALRIISRSVVVKKFGLDDYFILPAYILALGLCFCLCFAVRYGLGRHEHDIPASWQPTLDRLDYAFTVLYQPALMTTKTSILVFYLSLPTKNAIFKWACIGTLFLVNAGGLALTFVTVFQCHPIGAAFVTPEPANATCTDIVTIYLSSAPLNIITDLALLFLPMPILTGMRLPLKQKVILVITFGFGAFVAVVDVVRVAYLQSAALSRLLEIDRGDASSDTEFNDFSWYGSFSFMWTMIEVDVGIMCACVPALKPLVSRFLPRLLRDPGDSSDHISPHTSSRLHDGDGDDDGSAAAHLAEVQRVPSVADSVDHVERRDFSVSHAVSRLADSPGPMNMSEFLAMPPSSDPPKNRTGSATSGAEFLTVPADMADMAGVFRTDTAMTNTSRNTQPAAPTFFDFVNMNRKKSLVYLTPRESIFPLTMVMVIFFIWGFEYGLIDVLNRQFQRVAHMTAGQATGIHSAYYAGYFAGPILVGRLVLMHWGFKACFTVGLAIYACGTLIFWPAAVLTSFPAFLITNFIAAFGLSILEVSANPFAVLCGPPRYGEIRLNLAQGVQAIGTVIAPLIANRAFFTRTLNTPLLVNAQWAYLGIALFTILLAVAFYYLPLPEATDDELEDSCERMDNANRAQLGPARVIWVTLALGIVSQFCYVGGQEVNGTLFNSYISSETSGERVSNFLAIAHTAFAVSRFAAAGLGFWIKPRYLLLFFYIGAIVFESLSQVYIAGAGTAMITMTFFMEGPLFSLIFVQSLRGMGKHTKLASVGITAAISGGAVFAPISSHIATSPPRLLKALVVATAAFAAGTLFPIYLNLVPQARRQVDPIRDAADLPHSPSRPSSDGSTSRHRVRGLLHPRKKPPVVADLPQDEWLEMKRDGDTRDGDAQQGSAAAGWNAL